MTVRYSSEKPTDCVHCYFWNIRKRKCDLKECHYIVHGKQQVITVCTDCPYGRNKPCIGWCTRMLLGQI